MSKFKQWWNVFLLLSLILPGIQAQRIIVNSNGDKIVMYPDGSWRMMETGDSLLIRQNLPKSEAMGADDRYPLSSDPYKGENQEYVLRQFGELFFNIKSQEKKVQQEFRAATNAQFKASQQWENANTNKNMIEPDHLAELNEAYEQSIRNLRRAKLNQKEIRKIFDEAKKIAGLEPKKLAVKMNRLKSRFNMFLNNQGLVSTPLNHAGQTPVSTNKADIPPKDSGAAPSDMKSASEKSGAIRLPLQNHHNEYRAEPFHCEVESDTVDEATGRRHTALTESLIFTHTDPDLRPYFKNKELITCYGKLSKIDAYVYLQIEFQIASSHSQNNFGSLQNGSLLRLKLLDGEYISLYNLKSDRGHIDPYSGNTIFNGQYALGKDEIRLMQSSSLDKIRILWSTGYEDYDVYKVDFFIDQLNCLLNR